MLGRWFKRTEKRDGIFLATKFGILKDSKTYEIDSSGPYCKKACEESLKRLGVDSIDLCKLCPDPVYPLLYVTRTSRQADVTILEILAR